MAETAAFIYDPAAMANLKTDLTQIRTEAQESLKDLQAQKAVAEATLAEAENNYNKELAVYEAAMAKYKAALVSYEQAMAAYESAMESFTEAMKDYKAPEPPNPCPDNWTPPSPPTPPTPPTPPVEPTPPSPDAMNAAKAALAAVNESINQVQSDIECLNTLVDTITNINNQVLNSDQEAVHLLTNDFFKLWEFSGMNATGNDVANAIVNNAKAVKDGYDYIDTANGRLYLDLFADEKLSMPQYIKLGETIGATALVALMQQNGWGAEAAYHAAHTVDNSVDYKQVKSLFNDFANSNRQSPIHTDKSSSAQINEAMGSMDEDTVIIINGSVGIPVVDIPAFKQYDKFRTCDMFDYMFNKTYEYITAFTVPGTAQYKLRQIAQVDAETGICYTTIDGLNNADGTPAKVFYGAFADIITTAATGTARCGDVLEVTWEDGTKDYMIVADAKGTTVYGQTAGDQYGTTRSNGIELVLDKTANSDGAAELRGAGQINRNDYTFITDAGLHWSQSCVDIKLVQVGNIIYDN